MTLQEYKNKIAELESQFKKDKFSIQKEFASSNKTKNVGDIIESDYEKILCDSISIYLSYEEPQCCYNGFILKKDNTIRLDKSKSSILQNRIIN